MKDIQVLKKKKESLLSRLFGLKRKVEEEEITRTHRVEIETLETEVRSVEDQIFDTMVSEAREKVGELEVEAIKLTEEKSTLEKRTEEINVRLIEIFTACSAIIPRQRRQVSSKHAVVMTKEIEEREFTGFFERSVDARENRLPYTITKRTVEVFVPAFPSQIQHAQSLGYELKEGEKVEPPEELTNDNSMWMPLIPMPDVLNVF
jgi:hypothetical protein